MPSGTAPSTATPGSPTAPWSRSPQHSPSRHPPGQAPGGNQPLPGTRIEEKTLMSETRSVTIRAAAPGGVAVGGPRRLGLALLVLATAQLMVVLDATIVNVALPHIQRALGFSGSGLEWVVN